MPEPFAGAALLDFLLRHAVDGVETGGRQGDGGGARWEYARTLRLPHGPGAVRLVWVEAALTAEVVADPRDTARVRRAVAHLVNAGTDVRAVEAHLARDPALAPLVAATPGLRVPGALDAPELVLRTVVGQQVSLASARSVAATLARRHGDRAPVGGEGLDRLFPSPAALAELDPATLPMPRSRGRALVAVAARLADGRLDLGEDVPDDAVRTALLACPGIGPWTADYVLMRARHAPDVLLATDLVVGREVAARRADPGRWSPWRSYAVMQLWHDFLRRRSR